MNRPDKSFAAQSSFRQPSLHDARDKSCALKTGDRSLFLHNETELTKLSECVAKLEVEVQELSKDIREMGALSLLWDSKVPEKDKKNYDFFTIFSLSDRDKVSFEIKKYVDFYKEIGAVVHKIKITEEGSYGNENLHSLVFDLNEKLSEMFIEAVKEKEITTSSKIYDLHTSFIQKHGELQFLMKRAECVALKKGLIKATNAQQQADVEELNESGRIAIERYKCVQWNHKTRKDMNDQRF